MTEVVHVDFQALRRVRDRDREIAHALAILYAPQAYFALQVRIAAEAILLAHKSTKAIADALTPDGGRR
jgi:hypothetical protein